MDAKVGLQHPCSPTSGLLKSDLRNAIARLFFGVAQNDTLHQGNSVGVQPAIGVVR